MAAPTEPDLELNIGVGLQNLNRQLARVEADFLKAARRQVAEFAKANKKIATDFERLRSRANMSLGGIGVGLAPVLGSITAALSVREVARYADAWTGAKNALAVAGVTGEAQVYVLDQLYQAAQRNAAPVTALADLYGKAAQASDNLGASQSELLQFSDGVATALRVAGISATTASGSLTQLGQLLGSARVQAEEFNSINEGARPILMAVASGLDAAGGSVSKLKQLVNDGEVSGRQFFQAFLRGLPQIEGMAANATTTIDQGITKVTNAFTRYIGQTDESLSATQRLVGGLSALADNFDNIADIALRVAAIIGAGILGRSIAGMVTSLGLGTVAAVRFVGALRAASSLSGVATAIGGLSAAAGPLGAVVGGAAVGALMLYSSASSDAEARSRDFRSELEALGLVSPIAADAVAEVAKSIDDLSNPERLAKIRELREEIAAVRGGPISDIVGGGDSFTKIANEARRGINGQWAFNEFEAGDSEALRRIIELADAARNGAAGLDEIRTAMAEIENQDISGPARELAQRLPQLAEYFAGLGQLQESLGDSPEFRQARLEVSALEEQLQSLIGMPGVDEKIVREVLAIIDSFQSGARSADDVQRALVRVADADPAVSQYIARLAPLFGALKALKEDAAAAAAGLASAAGAGGTAGFSQEETDRITAAIDRGDKLRAEGEAYVAEQARLNALTRDQLALENERARVLKDMPTLTAAQVDQVARGNLAAQDRRSDEGKSDRAGKKEREGYTDAVEATERDIAGLRAQAEALLALNGAYTGAGDAADHARKRAELLTAAQQAGVEVTPEVASAIEEIARRYAEAGYSAEEAQEALDRVKDRAETGANAVADIFTSVASGSKSAKDAVGDLLMELARVQAQQAFLGMAGGGGILGAFGSLLTPVNGARAQGGPVQAGGLYKINENTPNSEYWVPPQSGTVLNVPQAQAAVARGLQTLSIGARQSAADRVQRVAMTITLDDDGKLAGIAQRAGAEAAVPVAVEVVRNSNAQQTKKAKRK